jgi:hypothetical protein
MSGDHSPDVTALLIDWRQGDQRFATAARMMRRVLVDAARAEKNQKRGGPFVV